MPHQALALLPVLHRQAGRELDLWRLLASSPPFCVALMLESGAALSWSAGATNTALGPAFVWAAAVLAGIVAMTRNHICGFTRVPRAISLPQAARELRLLLVYTGLAWGLGAFLILPPSPVWTALVFAAVPSLSAALILKREKSAIAFAVPVALLSAGGILWG